MTGFAGKTTSEWIAATASALLAIVVFKGGEGGVGTKSGVSPLTSFGGIDGGGGGTRNPGGGGLGLGRSTMV